MTVRGVVLAGGASSRMGVAKALVRVGGTPCVRLVVEGLLQAGLPGVAVVTGPGGVSAEDVSAALKGIHAWSLLDDGAFRPPGASGPLCGLVAAWGAHPRDALLCWPVDTPWPPPPLVRWLAARTRSTRLPGNPLQGLFMPSAGAVARQMLEGGHTGVARLWSRVPCSTVGTGVLATFDPAGAWRASFNTPAELATLQPVAPP